MHLRNICTYIHA